MSNFPLLDTVFNSCKQKNNSSDLKTFLKIISDNCDDLLLLDRVGYIQSELKDYNNCIETLKKCLLVSDDKQSKFAVRANLAKMYNHLNDPAISIAYSKLNLQEEYNYDTLMEISFSHYLLGNYAESEKMMRDLITHPNLPDDIRGRVEYNLGSYDLEKGNFKKGIKNFIEVGHKIKIWNNVEIPNIPKWSGESIKNKIIYIHSEGGIGDEIINVRFVDDLKKLKAKPVWITNNKNLSEVFNRNDITTITDISNIDYKNSVQCMSMYLPILLNVDKNDVRRKRYLKPSEEYIKKWEKILPAGKKIGIKFTGNPQYEQDLHRSLPVDFVKNIKFDGIKINLQLEKEFFFEDMFNAGQYIKNIEDTLAILWLCDDLVTSCTSIAHMNGSLGKRGIVCPPIACYYVWMGDAIWYESMSVIRQTKHKKWDDVLEKVNSLINERNA